MKLTTSFLFLLLSVSAAAQFKIQSFGKVDQASFDLKECPFEPDANAMVLFDEGNVFFNDRFEIVLERHKRIKIFNEKGKGEADFRLEFNSLSNYETITYVQAQTINMKDGKIVVTKLDKNQKFTEKIDKYRSAIVFTLPDVQEGSILDIKYTWQTLSYGNFPSWTFQSRIPVGYSEFKSSAPDIFTYKPLMRIHQPFVKNISTTEGSVITSGGNKYPYTKNIKVLALKDVPSLPQEPYMTCNYDNLQSIMQQLTQIRPLVGFISTGADTWQKISVMLCQDEDFGLQFKKKLEGEQELIAKAATMKSKEEKIAFLFNAVRDQMKWNSSDAWYAIDGIAKAWQKKSGNSTEINLILYRLLTQSGIHEASPMVASTRKHGKVFMSFPWIYQFNRTAVYIPVDSARYYVLDASDKNNQYNIIPAELLNNHALIIDGVNRNGWPEFITAKEPSVENIFISATIQPDGKMTGTVKMYLTSYHRSNTLQRITKEGEEKEKEYYTADNNRLKIDSLTTDGLKNDSLFINSGFKFNLELAALEGDYLFFTPNMFSSLQSNPFLKESRKNLIDMGYNNKHYINGIYEIPKGFQVNELPKPISLVMPDKSITFRRVIGTQNNQILVRFQIDFKKAIYTQDEYPALHEFYKKMYEMLNEQIVLKKI